MNKKEFYYSYTKIIEDDINKYNESDNLTEKIILLQKIKTSASQLIRFIKINKEVTKWNNLH